MTRGTFANIRIRNLLAPGTEGGAHAICPMAETTIYEAAMQYAAERVLLIVLAGARIRHRQQPRLGRQGNPPARRPRP